MDVTTCSWEARLGRTFAAAGFGLGWRRRGGIAAFSRRRVFRGGRRLRLLRSSSRRRRGGGRWWLGDRRRLSLLRSSRLSLRGPRRRRRGWAGDCRRGFTRAGSRRLGCWLGRHSDRLWRRLGGGGDRRCGGCRLRGSRRIRQGLVAARLRPFVDVLHSTIEKFCHAGVRLWSLLGLVGNKRLGD